MCEMAVKYVLYSILLVCFVNNQPVSTDTKQMLPMGGGADADPLVNDKRNKIREMMKYAWSGYSEKAFGHNEVNAKTGKPHFGSVFGSHRLGLTIISSLDTLYIMGLEAEYFQAYDWLKHNFTLLHNVDVSVYELNKRLVGGLLSLYSFTGDKLFKDKAKYVASKLLPAFGTNTGIPRAMVNLMTGASRPHSWTPESILSEFGALNLEFTYLSDVTGDHVYYRLVHSIRERLDMSMKPNGLYPVYLNPDSAHWGPMKMTLGAMGDSFYEYLLKSWLQSGRKNIQSLRMYQQAMDHIINDQVGCSSSGLTYVGEMESLHVIRRMEHQTCFAGGLLALGSSTYDNDTETANKHMRLGKELAHTCHESYRRTATGLGPESFSFHSTPGEDATSLSNDQPNYRLRPEVVETYFILWRLTHEQKYRDWGWEVVQSLEKYCRSEFGYSGLVNVYKVDGKQDEVQQSYFLAETLKYLYLLFSNDTLLPLDQWVFNTEAHPLPILGANPLYRSQGKIFHFHADSLDLL